MEPEMHTHVQWYKIGGYEGCDKILRVTVLVCDYFAVVDLFAIVAIGHTMSGG